MNYFRDAAGNERSTGGGSSSRKGKKSNSDKPKQPQRGLGVAQLEKIRLHSQLGFHPQEDMIRIQTPPSSFSSSTTYNGQQNIMMDMGELERSNTIYGQSHNDPRWNASNAIFEGQHYGQPGTTRHLFHVELEDSMRKNNWSDSISQNSNSNANQELDLELRLSL